MDLTTNEEYSLQQIFSTSHRKIIIPDFQRDYCWGDKTHGENNDSDIVSGFMDTLIGEFDNGENPDSKNKELLLGKIDVYQNPENHIYLTDGQQRLTTLYLLIGLLYKQTKNLCLKDCLISSFEEDKDDKEPYLQYSIRESTVFFLRDLVNEFFLKDDLKSLLDGKGLEKQSWYFNDYKLDPTIKSIIAALKTIESKLKSKILDSETLNHFSLFVIEHIKIQYHDVVDRKHGEERFVIINTTGRSLTVSENIKPILLGNIKDKDYTIKWEERETFFWKYRNIDIKEEVADNGVNDFLTWSLKILEKKEQINLIKDAKEYHKNLEYNISILEHLNSTFKAVKRLIKLLEDEHIQQQFQFINDNKSVIDIKDLRNLNETRTHNILLPLLAFMLKNEDTQDIFQFLRRLRKNYFDKEWQERNTNYVDWRDILKIIDFSSSLKEVLEFDNVDKKLKEFEKSYPSNWYNEEAKHKSELKKYQEEIEVWEDDKDFMGDLSFLFSINKELKDKDSITQMESYIRFFDNYQNTIGLIRNKEKAKENPKMANLFRLFRLFIGCDIIGHIYRASWDFEGVPFSTLNREHLKKEEFKELCSSKDEAKLFNKCQNYLLLKITELDLFNIKEETFTTKKFIKTWLTLKVFNANKSNTLLDLYDGDPITGVSAYHKEHISMNLLIKSEPFSLGNSICGFGQKSGGGGGGIYFTYPSLWQKPHVIDSSFDGMPYKEKERTPEHIKQNQKKIDEIIQYINSL